MEKPLGERFWVQGLAHRLWHVDWMSGGSNLYIIWQTAPPPGHWSAQEQGWWFKKSLNAAWQKITENTGEFYIRLQTPVAPVIWEDSLSVCCGLTPIFFWLSSLGTWLINILSTVFSNGKWKRVSGKLVQVRHMSPSLSLYLPLVVSYGCCWFKLLANQLTYSYNN